MPRSFTTHVARITTIWRLNTSHPMRLLRYVILSQDSSSCTFLLPCSISNISKVFSPEKDFCSAHEGQVVLRVKYPVSRSSTKGQFEQSMRDLLAVEGPICAWQKMAATEAGTFHMIAEFEDCAHAGRAINRLNAKQVGVSRILKSPCIRLTVIRIFPTLLSSH